MLFSQYDHEHRTQATSGRNSGRCRLMYPSGEDYISRNQIIGFVRGYTPFVGCIVIDLPPITHFRDMARISLKDEIG